MDRKGKRTPTPWDWNPTRCHAISEVEKVPNYNNKLAVATTANNKKISLAGLGPATPRLEV
jgi:hypothetical protein